MQRKKKGCFNFSDFFFISEDEVFKKIDKTSISYICNFSALFLKETKRINFKKNAWKKQIRILWGMRWKNGESLNFACLSHDVESQKSVHPAVHDEIYEQLVSIHKQIICFGFSKITFLYLSWGWLSSFVRF